MNWGGARTGAGRPAKGPIPSEPHKRRPRLSARHPVRVTARLSRALHHLYSRDVYRALRRAVALSLARDNFRIRHLLVRGSRVELIVEADHALALARGMQGFQVSAARALNRKVRRHGAAFPDRYRMRILATRSDVRAAIQTMPFAYVITSPESWLLRVEFVRMVSRDANRWPPWHARDS